MENKTASLSSTEPETVKSEAPHIKNEAENVKAQVKAQAATDAGADAVASTQTSETEATASQVFEEAEKIKIEFPYSELVRDRIPKTFEVVETVATKWINNEKFENLGLPNPVAEVVAVKALEKAKEVEKKLEEKGVIQAAKMGATIAKMQFESLISKYKK